MRESFFALLHLEDYARRIVRPHERTLAGPKADRLKVLRAARANLSPVFLLYEDREEALAPLPARGGAARAVRGARGERRHARARAHRRAPEPCAPPRSSWPSGPS